MKTNEATRRPGDVTELRAMFASKDVTLPKQLERVARMALAKPDLVAFGSARSVATACSVSPTTVTRLATVLGFDNFRDLKTFFRQHLRSVSPI
ncbi:MULTISPECIES: MurR/RpiR family transcriptional regulator [Ensifer]|uniref:MurR/RpiR family transcriptional regulator n=1 Tax=Ensifer TaxID=106591 RepID=UPI0008072EC3|nr:MurR/RpiR family transcriptional regulator [Ensifer adhaerens]